MSKATTTPRSFDLRGIRCTLRGPEVGWASLLQWHPPADSQDASPSLGSLVIEVGTAATPSLDPMETGEGRPAMYQGRTRCRIVDDGWAIWDGATRIDVPVDGGTVWARVHSDSLDDRHHFVEATCYTALMLGLRRWGRYHVHGGAVVRQGQTVLVLGDSGAGKSTTSLGLAVGADAALGDDEAYVDADGTLVSFPQPWRATETTRAAFAELPWRPGTAKSPKSVLLPADLPAPLISHAPAPSLIVLPTIDPTGVTRIEAASQADGLGALFTTSVWATIPGIPGQERHHTALVEMANRSQTVWLRLGPDALADPQRVRDCVDEALSRIRHQRS